MGIVNIVLFVIVIVLIYALIRYVMTDVSKLSGLSSAQSMQTINPQTASNTIGNSTNYSYSIWFFIDDWNYRYGEAKTIFGRMLTTGGTEDSNKPCPVVTLGATENDINVSLSVYPGEEDETSTPTSNPYVGRNIEFSDKTVAYVTNTGVVRPYTTYEIYSGIVGKNGCPNNDPVKINSAWNYAKGSKTDTIPEMVVGDPMAIGDICDPLIPSSSENSNVDILVDTSTISNVPIQKWCNLFISVSGRTLDIYLDGKLVKTSLLPGVARIDPNSQIYITPNGGFSGWTSNFQYWPEASNPQKVWNIYSSGYGSSILGSLFGRYGIKISLMDGEVENANIKI